MRTRRGGSVPSPHALPFSQATTAPPTPSNTAEHGQIPSPPPKQAACSRSDRYASKPPGIPPIPSHYPILPYPQKLETTQHKHPANSERCACYRKAGVKSTVCRAARVPLGTGQLRANATGVSRGRRWLLTHCGSGHANTAGPGTLSYPHPRVPNSREASGRAGLGPDFGQAFSSVSSASERFLVTRGKEARPGGEAARHPALSARGKHRGQDRLITSNYGNSISLNVAIKEDTWSAGRQMVVRIYLSLIKMVCKLHRHGGSWEDITLLVLGEFLGES